jgi:hypothetical protein
MASFHARDDLFDPNADLRDKSILDFVLLRELATAGFFLRFVDHDTFEVVALKTTVAV